MATAGLTASSIAVGEVIAEKFRVERVIGEGGMGFVVEATHLLLDQRVALKFLRREVVAQEDVVARFTQEARAAVKLKSEHVARVLDVGDLGGSPYIVMELLEGTDLEVLLRTRGPLPIHEAVELIIEAAEGISEAHARNIVHRDIKPANLFLAQRGDGWATLKILDFGISKAARGNTHEGVAQVAAVKTLSLLGSPYYMSPEQVRSASDVDRRTDIWSLGAVLFELVTGQTAFRESSLVPLMNEILDKPHRSLRAIREDAPPELEAVVDRMLAKEPAERFQSMGELALALLQFTPSKRSRVVAAQAVSQTRSSGIDTTLPIPSGIPPSPSSGDLPAAETRRVSSGAVPLAKRSEGAVAAAVSSTAFAATKLMPSDSIAKSSGGTPAATDTKAGVAEGSKIRATTILAALAVVFGLLGIAFGVGRGLGGTPSAPTAQPIAPATGIAPAPDMTLGAAAAGRPAFAETAAANASATASGAATASASASASAPASAIAPASASATAVRVGAPTKRTPAASASVSGESDIRLTR